VREWHRQWPYSLRAAPVHPPDEWLTDEERAALAAEIESLPSSHPDRRAEAMERLWHRSFNHWNPNTGRWERTDTLVERLLDLLSFGGYGAGGEPYGGPGRAGSRNIFDVGPNTPRGG
jgi:hypothetical protein